MRMPEMVDSRAFVFRRWSRGTKLWGQGKAKSSSAHDWQETGRRDEIEEFLGPDYMSRAGKVSRAASVCRDEFHPGIT